MRLVSGLRFAGVLSLIIAAGCMKAVHAPPRAKPMPRADAAIEAADKAVAEARAAGAEAYDPDSFSRVKLYLNSAKTERGRNRESEAIRDAEKAVRLAQEAKAAARSGIPRKRSR